MKKTLVIGALLLTLAACGDRAKELFDTAQFEERQYNVEHAQQLYREIVDEYPDSPYAARAKECLNRLGSR